MTDVPHAQAKRCATRDTVALVVLLSMLLVGVSEGGMRSCDVDIARSSHGTSKGPEAQVEQLAVLSRTEFTQGNSECAIQAVEAAERIVVGLPNQVDRAASGYEIKDVVFDAIEHRRLTEVTYEKRLLATALQSVGAKAKIIASSGPDERFNDAMFLRRVAKYFLANGRRSEAKDAYLLAVQLDQSLPPDAPRLPWIELSHYMDQLIKAYEFGDAAELLSSMRQEERQRYYTNHVITTVRFVDGVSLYRDKHVRSVSREALNHQLTGMEALLPLLERPRLPSGSTVSKTWVLFPYLFLGDGYFVLGDRTKAKAWFDKALLVARSDENPVVRCRSLIRIAIDLYRLDYDKRLAVALLSEANEIATNHPDPKWQKDLMRSVDTVKKWLK